VVSINRKVTISSERKTLGNKKEQTISATTSGSSRKVTRN
jgi:hypothetical protein